MKNLLTLLVVSLCAVQSAWAEDVVANVTLKEKNSLSTEILALAGIDDVKTVTHLTVTTNAGVQLGDEDWTTLKSMVGLVELDLNQASAVAVPDREFSGFSNLVTVKLPKDLTTIGESAFTNVGSLITVEVPSTVISIGGYAFYQCSKLETCDLSACQLEEIPKYCFSGCSSLTSFTIPATVKTIGYLAFNYCKQFTSPLPANISSIGYSAFEQAAMTDIDVVLPEWCEIGNSAFNYSGVRSIDFPTTYYNPNGYEYYQCSNLQTVTLRAATKVRYRDNGNVANVTLRVPSHLVAAYKSDPDWSEYKDAVAITPAVGEYNVFADLNLSHSAMRLEGAPSVSFRNGSNNNYNYANLTIVGEAPQTFNNFTGGADYTSPNYHKSTMILNAASNVSVSGDYKQQIELSQYYWYFFSLPFDFVVGDVVAEDADFVIRTYNGARRNAEDADNGNWSANLGADVEIKAGTGFIIKVSKDSQVTFKAKSGGTNYAFSKESDEVVIPLAANNSNANAAAANTGWNMVGNPYQAFYNIHKMNYTAPFAVYNYNWGRYDTYSPADDDYALQPFQALFVQCPNGVESIDFPAVGRQLTSEVTSQNGARRLGKGGRRLFDIEVTDGTLSDKTRLVVNADAAMDYEIGRDASKFFAGGSATPQIYSLDGDGTQYAINERPAAGGMLRLGIRFASDGEYTLSAVRNDMGQVILTDNETGIKTDLEKHGYTFEAEGGVCESRFTLSFGDAVTGISMAKTVETPATEVYTLDGVKVGNTTGDLPKGVYVVRQGQQTQKVIVK